MWKLLYSDGIEQSVTMTEEVNVLIFYAVRHYAIILIHELYCKVVIMCYA